MNKISKILIDKFPTSEASVVHFFVEAKKIVEDMSRLEQERFILVTFYRDWLVHTKKAGIPESIKIIMRKLDMAMPSIEYLNNNQVIPIQYLNFVYMIDLRVEIHNLLDNIKLPKDFINDNKRWINFVHFLFNVLVDQPILKPIPSIQHFSFLYTKDQSVIWKIIFNDERKTFNFSYVIHS